MKPADAAIIMVERQGYAVIDATTSIIKLPIWVLLTPASSKLAATRRCLHAKTLHVTMLTLSSPVGSKSNRAGDMIANSIMSIQ